MEPLSKEITDKTQNPPINHKEIQRGRVTSCRGTAQSSPTFLPQSNAIHSGCTNESGQAVYPPDARHMRCIAIPPGGPCVQGIKPHIPGPGSRMRPQPYQDTLRSCARGNATQGRCTRCAGGAAQHQPSTVRRIPKLGQTPTVSNALLSVQVDVTVRQVLFATYAVIPAAQTVTLPVSSATRRTRVHIFHDTAGYSPAQVQHIGSPLIGSWDVVGEAPSAPVPPPATEGMTACLSTRDPSQ